MFAVFCQPLPLHAHPKPTIDQSGLLFVPDNKLSSGGGNLLLSSFYTINVSDCDSHGRARNESGMHHHADVGVGL